MSNLPNSVHPWWCLRGEDCAADRASGGRLHYSRLVSAAPRGDEVIQVRAGLWRMDVGPASPEGVLLELSAGADVERWPIDLAQARALLSVLRGLLPRADAALSHAA